MEEPAKDQTNQSIASDPVEVGVPQSLARAVLSRRSEYLRPCQIRVKVGTWNVAARPGTDKDLASWFVEDVPVDKALSGLDIAGDDRPRRSTESGNGDTRPEPMTQEGEGGYDLYVLGLQEVVDLNRTGEYMRGLYVDSGPMDKWKAALEAAIPQGYQLVVSEQMTGLLLLIYASPTIAPTISNISTQQVGTGLLGYFGNKGAIATRLVLGETTKLLFVNCHLASGAGPAALDRRCWDVAQILAKTQFDPVVIGGVSDDEGDRIGDEDFAFWFGDMNFRLDGLPGDDIRRLLTLHARGEYDLNNDKPAPIEGDDGIIVMRSSESDDDTATMSSMYSRDHSFDQSFDSESSLPDPDDFPEDPSQDPASLQATIDSLLPHDQLKRVIAKQKLFHDGWREGPITFLPTFKYDIGTFGLFDSSEKQRAPSWCDRVLYRTRKDKEAYDKKLEELKETKRKDEEMRARGLEEDEDVLFSYDPDTDGEEQPPKPASTEAYDEYDEYDMNEDRPADGADPDHASLDFYSSQQRITSSDHKPVLSTFTLRYDAVDPEKKARIHSEIAFELDRAENEGRPGVTLIIEGGHGATDGVVDFGEVGFFEAHSCSITIANTSSAAASFEFLHETQTSEDERGAAQWLKTSFHRPDQDGTQTRLGSSVTLEPGETILAVVEARVSEISHVRALNDASCKLDDVLVLRVEGGKDHFVPVRGTWLPSCFGRSIDELIRVPECGIRKFIKDNNIQGAITYDWDVHCSAPRELFKLTEVIQTMAERCVADEAMLEHMTLPRDPGWPLDSATWTVEAAKQDELKAALISALDTNAPLADALPVELLSTHKLEIYSAVLLLFLSSLIDGLVPPHLWAKLSIELPNLNTLPVTSWPDVKNHILDLLAMSPSHNIAFVFLTATLSRVAAELNPATAPGPTPGALTRRLSFRPGETEAVRKRRARERRYAEIVSPLLFRSSDDKDKAKKDRERIVLEMFLRKDDRS
ncbi:phosphatidylinositol polyphosphate phosphatase [Trichoderma citrinoviride]|uniref:Phosphatidylinositol polyphosphate phosphatase n=1 Tax=Trichoderma citrinoviride TaxID=58853 RepID=A0A2T4B1Z0_9HYPO|nr:phosphatidylinositol polyphosphate phosphatase [Trichoderma citrinoviride]PTB63343.1 phosphatidylinositol polyphosphate phosphatase [Trichoderma citrinoviride]